jgi:NTP pyrophosphatase (non-canonical NTP hydrolase)
MTEWLKEAVRGVHRGEPLEDVNLTALRDEAHQTAVDHGFTGATIGEEIALMHTELSEALEDHRAGKAPNEVWYLDKTAGAETPDYHEGYKPCGIPSEMADVIIRVLDFCGKYKIDIERAVLEKMAYNRTRSFRHGGKKL